MPRSSCSSEESDSSSSSHTPPTVESILDGHTPALCAFLRSDIEHPVWQPSPVREGEATWEPVELTRLNSLRIPSVLGSDASNRARPDMLLYRLGNLELLDVDFPSRLDRLVAGDEHICISNVSGSGKTRLLFETLARHWGIYFTCTEDPIVDPYGSFDIEAAFNSMSGTVIDGIHFQISIPGTSELSSAWRTVVANNCRIAHRRLNPVILSRLLFLQHFCSLLEATDISDESARLKWLLLQLRPRAYLGSDVFTGLVFTISMLDEGILETRIAQLYEALRSRIAFVAIDEANVAIVRYPRTFASHDYRRASPMLRQLVYHVSGAFPASRLLVAGTLLDVDAVAEPIKHSGSNFRSVRVFHELGCFDSHGRTSAYLRHFFGESFSDADCRMVHSWFLGRHRLLAVLVMYGLIYGTSRLSDVMDTLIFRFTGHQRSSSRLLNLVNVGLAFSDDTLERCPVASLLRGAALNYVFYRQPTVSNSQASALVGIGAAFYGRSVSTAEIFEPLIMLNLARWLLQSQHYGIHAIMLRECLDRTHPLHDAAFVEGLSSCLRDALSGSGPLSLHALLDFEGRPPAWAEQSARLVLPRLLRRRPQFETYTRSLEVYIESASSPDDVFRWLENASRPFLIPDPAFGAALLFVIELADRRRLLVSLDPRFLRAPTGGPALRDPRPVPMRASKIYRRDRASRERLFAALAKFPPSTPAGKRKTSEPPISKYNILSALCFSRLSRAGTTYDPPAASLKLDYLLSQPPPVEFEMSHVLDAINDS